MCALKVPHPRRSQRIPAQLPVKLVWGSLFTKAACDALTLDISKAGARVRARVSLSPGQSVKVVPSEGLERAIPGRIVWVNRLDALRLGEAGIEFVQS